MFNQEPYRNSPIILSRENFGCGSSREGAVWALKGMGIKAVIAPYFGDIFNNNCFQNGILPVPMRIEEVELLADEMKASPGNARVTVDLENCVVISPTGRSIPFKVDVVRDRASLARITEVGTLENVYRLQLMNATEQAQTYRLSVSGLDRLEIKTATEIEVAPAQARWVIVRADIPYGSAPQGSHKIIFDIQTANGKDRVTEKSVFMVPR